MTEWKEYKLGEIATRITSGGTPKSSEASYYDGDIPWLNTKEINFNRITKTERCITQEGLNNSSAKWIPKGAVIVAMYGATAAKVAYSLIDLTTNQACCNLIIKESMADGRFVYYYIQSSYEELLNLACGAAQQNLSVGVIADFPISLPSLDEQHRIASILTSMDDKIDLLRRENATLEAMAETLFRQWFVVEAKEEWEEGKVIDLTKHIKDSVNPQKYPNTVFQHYSIPAYDDGKKPSIETGENIQSSKYVIPQKCILFSKLNPHKDKRVWLMLDDVPDNAVCSTEFQIVKPNNSEYLYFMYGWLTFKDNYEEIASGVGGTSGSHQRIDPKSIFAFACPMVDVETIRNYNEKVEPLFYKQRNNQLQIQTLIQTRDGLLPRLMGGEIKL
jgi:type I restriction enzyme S subunit